MREQILDTALTLAESTSWEQLSLQQIAAALGISLANIYGHYRSKDDLVDAWFDRADSAMLSALITADLPPASRIEQALSALFVAVFIYWLNDSSAAQKRSLAILKHKLQLSDLLKLWH